MACRGGVGGARWLAGGKGDLQGARWLAGGGGGQGGLQGARDVLPETQLSHHLATFDESTVG